MESGPIIRAMLTNKGRFGLIAIQIAVTLAIVANCLVLIFDAREKLTVSSGLDDEHLVSVFVASPIPRSRGDVERDAWFARTREDLHRISGVQAMSASGFRPWHCSLRDTVKPVHENAIMTPVGMCHADEVSLDTIGLELDEGRWFSQDEAQREANNSIVITRAFGKRLFGDGPILGMLVEDFDGNRRTIIGIVKDLQSPDAKLVNDFPSEEARCAVFVPASLANQFVLRVESGKTAEIIRRIEQYFESRNVAGLSTVKTFAAIRDEHFQSQRTIVAIMGSLAIILLFIASVGIAGITSFAVTERTRQIGIRRALGATTTDILRYFLSETGIVTTLGIMIGSALAVLLNIAILRLYDSARLNAPVVIGCSLLLWFVALGAAFPPALRASRVSPAIATRNV